MQDIRERATSLALMVCIPENEGEPEYSAEICHRALRDYAVDLLMNLAGAIMPTNDAERAAVAWLQGEIVKVAQSIPEA